MYESYQISFIILRIRNCSWSSQSPFQEKIVFHRPLVLMINHDYGWTFSGQLLLYLLSTMLTLMDHHCCSDLHSHCHRSSQGWCKIINSKIDYGLKRYDNMYIDGYWDIMALFGHQKMLSQIWLKALNNDLKCQGLEAL